MTTQSIKVSEDQKDHWAYRQGKREGLNGNTTKRGIMAFGHGFAATPEDANNVKLWLAGFDAGMEEKEKAPVRASSEKWDTFGDLRAG
jgi:hypothetical protein